MTFLEEVKDELLNIRIKNRCCMIAELQGVLLFGSVPYEGNVIFGTESFLLAKRVSSFLRKTCHIDYPDRLSENAEGYKFLIPDDILKELSLKAENSVSIVGETELSVCCIKAFVRGAFLVAGSLSNPEKSYRMEIFTENEEAANYLKAVLSVVGVDAKETKRKNLFVVYTNKSESVSDMLKVTESSQAVFKILEARVIKDKRNETNRVINCDMANADRASENSYRETQAIKFIEKTAGLDFLKPKLRQAAQMRLENEGASLKELAALFDPPIPKSTLNNRLNKLIKIAEELGE